tara:strand:+ start:312 stop:530 length:219 start_codon:yes stop_codon:yes gene_type:complete
MKIKKKEADSFSGIPAIVLGKRTGKTDKKNEEIKATIFLSLSIKTPSKIFLVNKKKATTVNPNIKTGNIIAE